MYIYKIRALFAHTHLVVAKRSAEVMSLPLEVRVAAIEEGALTAKAK